MSQGALEEALNAFYFQYKGGYFQNDATTKEVIDSLQDMDIRDNDVFIVTYLKSGTIWAQQILSLILNEAYRNGREHIPVMARAPWIEYNISDTDFGSHPSARLFTSHLPYYIMPKGLKEKKGKGKPVQPKNSSRHYFQKDDPTTTSWIIYVYRNPKDVLVSYYHFIKIFVKLQYKIDWETFFDLFMSGRLLGGSWFNHIKGWYTQKEHYNILFISYEEMIRDLRSAVLKMCKFVDVELDAQTIDVVVEKSTFNNMKCDPLANYEFLPKDLANFDETKFLRKGTVGDWKNFMTVAQNEEFDMVYRRKIGDLPIRFAWDISNEKRS